MFFIALTIGAVGSLLGQQPTPQPSSPPKQGDKEVKNSPVASPEQKVLEKWVGTWDATIETKDSGGKTVTSSAKAIVRLAYGGRWLITEFDGTFAGAPFTGQEIVGYDPLTKKYILNWIDSAATSFSTGEGTYDRRTTAMTYTVSGRDDKTGKMAQWRQVDIWKDADNHEWTIRTTADGKEQIQMTIRYHRKP
jgi:hypothetical protein